MSARTEDTKFRRERQRSAAQMRARGLEGLAPDHPDMALLKLIAASPNGWHAAALDPYKKEHLKAAKLVVQRSDRIQITEDGRAALARAEVHERNSEAAPRVP